MSSAILDPHTEISTGIRCKNCHITINRASWKQCKLCKQFNLCEQCTFDKLEDLTYRKHRELHKSNNNEYPIDDKCMELVWITSASRTIEPINDKIFFFLNKKRIENDHDMSIVTTKLKQMNNQVLTNEEQNIKQELCSMIVDYHIHGYDIIIRILSLDGGGIRGYMPIKIIEQIIKDKYLPELEEIDSTNFKHRKIFHQGQLDFTKQFDYFVGTSTGGLISFCLAIGYDILDLKDIYSHASFYFNRNYFGPLLWSKYNPSRIHKKIDDIIETIQLKNGKKLSAENATLLDIHNYLNPDAFISDDSLKSSLVSHGAALEFADDESFQRLTRQESEFHRVKREKALLITAYNATKNRITIFNTSFAQHWSYRISDVLKATMAAPTYFPPQRISSVNTRHNSYKIEQSSTDIFVDGGIFANDPELVALWSIRMQWKKLINYHIMSIGTGDYNTPISSSNLGGYLGWLLKNGLLVNTLMDATRSLTETISANLAKFDNMKRIKFNYKLKEAISLDDARFIEIFDQEWATLKHGNDFKTLIYFYDEYIIKQNNSF